MTADIEDDDDDASHTGEKVYSFVNHDIGSTSRLLGIFSPSSNTGGPICAPSPSPSPPSAVASADRKSTHTPPRAS